MRGTKTGERMMRSDHDNECGCPLFLATIAAITTVFVQLLGGVGVAGLGLVTICGLNGGEGGGDGNRILAIHNARASNVLLIGGTTGEASEEIGKIEFLEETDGWKLEWRALHPPRPSSSLSSVN